MSDEQKNEHVKLEDFVSEVLVQIVNGIHGAQSKVAEKGAVINGLRFRRVVSGEGIIVTDGDQRPIVQEIEFDVAVTVSSQGNLKGGMGLFVPAAGIGYQAEKETANSTVSRIKFAVPVAFTQQKK